MSIVEASNMAWYWVCFPVQWLLSLSMPETKARDASHSKIWHVLEYIVALPSKHNLNSYMYTGRRKQNSNALDVTLVSFYNPCIKWKKKKRVLIWSGNNAYLLSFYPHIKKKNNAPVAPVVRSSCTILPYGSATPRSPVAALNIAHETFYSKSFAWLGFCWQCVLFKPSLGECHL